jgi:hypothetical protein
MIETQCPGTPANPALNLTGGVTIPPLRGCKEVRCLP